MRGLAVSCGFAVLAASLASGSPTLAKDIWTSKAPLPVAVAEVGAAAAGDKVYVIGGTLQEPGGKLNWASTVNLAYDPATDAWKERAPLPQGLTHVGVAALDGKVYAIGGFTNIVHLGPKNLAFVYDPETDTWRELPNISTPRGSVGVVAVGGKIHALGGRISERVIKIPTPPGAPEVMAGFGTVSTHQIYDPAAGRWSDGPSIPGPARDHMGIAVLDGKIHLFGGRTADVADTLDRHDVYDPATQQWTAAAPLPSPRSAGGFTVLGDKIIYAGGECKPGGRPLTPNAYDEVTVYDPATDSWSHLAPLPQARHAFGGATIKGIAYFAGGALVCGGGASKDLLSLTLD